MHQFSTRGSATLTPLRNSSRLIEKLPDDRPSSPFPDRLVIPALDVTPIHPRATLTRPSPEGAILQFSKPLTAAGGLLLPLKQQTTR